MVGVGWGGGGGGVRGGGGGGGGGGTELRDLRQAQKDHVTFSEPSGKTNRSATASVTHN